MSSTVRQIAFGAVTALFVSPALAQEAPTSAPISAEELANLVGDVPPPTKAALVLPLSALEVPEVAASVSPIVIDPESGVAIEGYDPVGYFTEERAMKGTPEFAAQYRGATFHFASAENQAMFLEDPERYAPAYGGYCTETLAAGALTPADPIHWTIHGDRLFLTRSAASTKAFRTESALTAEAAQRNYELSPLASSDTYNFRANN
ncbi:MAG: YHS domain-containing (seleno)protein [Pseudomonadota bacterium]